MGMTLLESRHGCGSLLRANQAVHHLEVAFFELHRSVGPDFDHANQLFTRDRLKLVADLLERTATIAGTRVLLD